MECSHLDYMALSTHSDSCGAFYTPCVARRVQARPSLDPDDDMPTMPNGVLASFIQEAFAGSSVELQLQRVGQPLTQERQEPVVAGVRWGQ